MAKAPFIYEWTEFAADLGGTRREQRRGAILQFLEEDLGRQYCYHVETLEDDAQVCLLRPTMLNKGMDFQVTVGDFKAGRGVRLTMREIEGRGCYRPDHKKIFRDLDAKRRKNPELLRKFMGAVEAVFNGAEPKAVLAKKRFDFGSGLTDEYILKVLKWLWIEQDVTYWNHRGKGRNWSFAYIRWVVSGEADIETIIARSDRNQPPPEKFLAGLPGR